jgi:hypothetical protein
VEKRLSKNKILDTILLKILGISKYLDIFASN